MEAGGAEGDEGVISAVPGLQVLAEGRLEGLLLAGSEQEAVALVQVPRGRRRRRRLTRGSRRSRRLTRGSRRSRRLTPTCGRLTSTVLVTYRQPPGSVSGVWDRI